MKKVSFKVAKAIKEAGYPQYGSCDEYYSQEGRRIDKFCDINKLIYPSPSYLEVWLWLWREKKKDIDIIFSADEGGWTFMQNPSPCDCGLYDDPEEAIIAAIEYLVNNNLIK